MDWMSLIIGGGISVPTGVITWWITSSRSRLDEKRRMKRELLTQLVSNRYDLWGDNFSQALNAAPVVFSESPLVMVALSEFHDQVRAPGKIEADTQRKLLTLVRTMFEDLELPHGDLTDEFLLAPFNTRQPVQIPEGG